MSSNKNINSLAEFSWGTALTKKSYTVNTSECNISVLLFEHHFSLINLAIIYTRKSKLIIDNLNKEDSIEAAETLISEAIKSLNIASGIFVYAKEQLMSNKEFINMTKHFRNKNKDRPFEIIPNILDIMSL